MLSCQAKSITDTGPRTNHKFLNVDGTEINVASAFRKFTRETLLSLGLTKSSLDSVLTAVATGRQL